MLTNVTNVLMLLFGYPKDTPICPKLSIAVNVPPMPQAADVNRISMSTLKRPWRIVKSSPRFGGLKIVVQQDGSLCSCFGCSVLGSCSVTI